MPYDLYKITMFSTGIGVYHEELAGALAEMSKRIERLEKMLEKRGE